MSSTCARARGGKALALAAAAPALTILATDSNRARLSKLPPRAERAGATIETRLLSPPNELTELADWRGKADLVLVDAPCSGSGTWRRNPEGRWRLTPERLDRLVEARRPGCSTSPPSWSPRADGWSTRCARFCPAKGQAGYRTFSAAVHHG